MYWAYFVHVAEAGRLDALCRRLARHPAVRLSLALSGALAASLDAEAGRQLGERLEAGQVELLAAPLGHALLPLLPAREIRRQIEEGLAALVPFWNQQPAGLVPPELAYSTLVGEIAAEMGFRYVLVDELSRPQPMHGVETRCYDIEGFRGLSVFFRQRAPASNGRLREGYVIKEGEPEWDDRPTCRLGDLLHLFPARETVRLLPSSGQTTPRELQEGQPYSRWDDSANDVHRLGWQLARLVMAAAERAERLGPARPETEALRRRLDLALDACLWDAASCRPRWDPGRVQACADRLVEAARVGAPVVGPAAAEQAAQLARRIGDLLRNWDSSGEAARRIARHHGENPKREAS